MKPKGWFLEKIYKIGKQPDGLRKKGKRHNLPLSAMKQVTSLGYTDTVRTLRNYELFWQ